MKIEELLKQELEKKILETKMSRSFAAGFELIAEEAKFRNAALKLIGDDEEKVKEVVDFAEKVFKLGLSTAVATAMFGLAERKN